MNTDKFLICYIHIHIDIRYLDQVMLHSPSQEQRKHSSFHFFLEQKTACILSKLTQSSKNFNIRGELLGEVWCLSISPNLWKTKLQTNMKNFLQLEIKPIIKSANSMLIITGLLYTFCGSCSGKRKVKLILSKARWVVLKPQQTLLVSQLQILTAAAGLRISAFGVAKKNILKGVCSQEVQQICIAVSALSLPPRSSFSSSCSGVQQAGCTAVLFTQTAKNQLAPKPKLSLFLWKAKRDTIILKSTSAEEV